MCAQPGDQIDISRHLNYHLEIVYSLKLTHTFILTMGQITCNVKGVTCTAEPTENNNSGDQNKAKTRVNTGHPSGGLATNAFTISTFLGDNVSVLRFIALP